MTIRKRSMVMAALFALALVLYGAGKYYSPSLVLYVVEQSLTQKAPADTDLRRLHQRLQALLAAAPDQNARMERLLQISEYLEKVQQLTPRELDELLAFKKPATSPAF